MDTENEEFIFRSWSDANIEDAIDAQVKMGREDSEWTAQLRREFNRRFNKAVEFMQERELELRHQLNEGYEEGFR